MSYYEFKHLAVPDFMNREAPPNYIAGLGRGATGFTTRSDIGPAREGTSFGPPGEPGSEPQPVAPPPPDPAEDENRYQDPDNERGLFNTAPYEADDEEADKIYDQVEQALDERRKAKRTAMEMEEIERGKRERPVVQEQFADLKRQLQNVSEDEWANIPDVGDLVGKNKRMKKAGRERFYAISDSIIQMGLNQVTGFSTQLDAQTQMGGIATPANASSSDGTITDFVSFGQARDKVLSLKLDQVSDSVSGQTTIDPKGYLTDLGSLDIKSDSEISDIKKARTLYKSVISSNPKHAPGWIAAARLEEFAGKMGAARSIITNGCEECPKSEDVWLESARLNVPENAKIILANAIRQLPQSVKIWLKACDLEVDVKAKKRVLRKALEFLPNSVKLWKAAIRLEDDPDDARILLSRAVECVPLCVDMWLALARLEVYANAKKVMNKARASIPTSHEIWIAAAKLEEQEGNEKMVDMIISKAVSSLAAKGTAFTREQWMDCAFEAEHDNVLTCQAIVRNTIGLGLEEEDLKHTWMDEAEVCVKGGHIPTARAIYAHALKQFPDKRSVWRQAAFFEKAHGTPGSLEELLQQAVKYCPQAEVLWLMGAKGKWLSGDVDGARAILAEAFRANPNSEQIWLAAIKLESETGQFSRAQMLLNKARAQAGTEKVWMKSAVLERQLGKYSEAMAYLDEALNKFPTAPKLWMIKGQIQEQHLNQTSAARETYTKACKICPKNIPLWLLASRMEENSGALIKARAILEKARLMNPTSDSLWCESVRLEVRGGNAQMAKTLMARALQECPQSGLLWSEAILMEPRPQRKSRSADALKKCDNDPLVICTIARLFWLERKLDKARNWLNKAIKLNSDIGDIWAWLLKFELQHGDETKVQEIRRLCAAADPHHGEVWSRIKKDLANIGKSAEDLVTLVAIELNNDNS